MRSLKGARRWPLTGGILMALALALALTNLRAGPASADSNTYTTISNTQTSLCLDSNSSNPLDPANGAVYTGQCNGSTSQNWSVSSAPGTGTVTFTDEQTGLCLESNFPTIADPNGAVFTEGCTGGTAQEWAPDITPNGYTGLCDLYTGLCLDSNDSGAVYTDPGNGDTNQSWNQQQIKFAARSVAAQPAAQPTIVTAEAETIYSDSTLTVTLTGMAITPDNEVTAYVSYQNVGSSALTLNCPSAADPTIDTLTSAGGTLIPASHTYCSDHATTTIDLRPGATLPSYAVFEGVQASSGPFTLTWQKSGGISGAVSGITLG